MAKKSKLKTPDWILNGEEEEKPKKKKEKTFKSHWIMCSSKKKDLK